ncbi:MAG TPA: hypothetical protein VH165_00680 [Kofleriaceae bacterium]|jgi:hypothetical protein|nr:hypothetical protein [Kofleriaceae bacterium]
MSDFKHPKTAAGPTTTGAAQPNYGTIYIGSIDKPEITVQAQYNPKELQVDKNVPWSKKNQANQTNATGLQLEFTGADGRTMSVELLFDGYEQKASVAGSVDYLNQMASVIQPDSTDENLRRPHLCVCSWGSTVDNFRCVIESLSTKYTMFSDAGVPLRATCTVKLKEADVVSKATDSAAGATPPPGSPGQ